MLKLAEVCQKLLVKQGETWRSRHNNQAPQNIAKQDKTLQGIAKHITVHDRKKTNPDKKSSGAWLRITKHNNRLWRSITKHVLTRWRKTKTAKHNFDFRELECFEILFLLFDVRLRQNKAFDQECRHFVLVWTRKFAPNEILSLRVRLLGDEKKSSWVSNLDCRHFLLKTDRQKRQLILWLV